MAGIERIAISHLRIDERTEVETALSSPGHPGFLADNHDIVALWLLLLMAGAGGVGVYLFGGIPILYAREAALAAGLLLIAWTVRTWVSTWNRRGCLFTSFGTFIVRGAMLKGVRHADVKAIRCRTIGARGKRFTVFEPVATDGRPLTLYAHRPWAAAATEAIQRVHQGKLPVTEY